MVLQRAPHRARIWGWTKSANETVYVGFDGKIYHNVSSPDTHRWEVTLDPIEASFREYTIIIKTQSDESAVLENILFGDVYLCGGQSNMQFVVSQSINGSEEIAAADKYPYIRVFTVGEGTTSTTPLDDLVTVRQPWSVASAKSIGGGAFDIFSAVCWFFGKNLFDTYGIPIGLISNNWGGTAVQVWCSSDSIKTCSKLAPPPPPNPSSLTSIFMENGIDFGAKDIPVDNSVLYNAMIHPFTPMRIRGVLWYQGESNILPGQGTTTYYSCQFPAMIADWRVKFNLTAQEMPFLFVQLAAYTQLSEGYILLPEIRLAQEVAVQLPYVAMATATDLGDPKSPWGDIHPRYKQEVGRRLALLASGLIYEKKQTGDAGPKHGRVVVSSSYPKAVVELHFMLDGTSPGEILVTKPAVCPYPDPRNCNSFEIMSSDGVWHNATIKLKQGNPSLLELHASADDRNLVPVAVRYGFSNWPLITLFNDLDVPATPFVYYLTPGFFEFQ